MPVPFVLCRNEVTGATAEIPETALPHLTDWVPDQPAPDTADGQGDPATEPEQPAGQRRTPKSKPADPANEKKES